MKRRVVPIDVGFDMCLDDKYKLGRGEELSPDDAPPLSARDFA